MSTSYFCLRTINTCKTYLRVMCLLFTYSNKRPLTYRPLWKDAQKKSVLRKKWGGGHSAPRTHCGRPFSNIKKIDKIFIEPFGVFLGAL